jgi:hypothetical protein
MQEMTLKFKEHFLPLFLSKPKSTNFSVRQKAGQSHNVHITHRKAKKDLDQLKIAATQNKHTHTKEKKRNQKEKWIANS